MLEDKGISGGIFSRPIPSHIQNTITFPVPKSLQKKKNGKMPFIRCGMLGMIYFRLLELADPPRYTWAFICNLIRLLYQS